MKEKIKKSIHLIIIQPKSDRKTRPKVYCRPPFFRFFAKKYINEKKETVKNNWKEM